MELASLGVVERAYEATFLRRPRSYPSFSTAGPSEPLPTPPTATPGWPRRPSLLCHAVMLRLGYGHLFCLPA